MKMEFSADLHDTLLRLVCGDITRQNTDAIVNAANSTLLGGGGVDGAIHRAGGPRILEECKTIVQEMGSCATGEAVITSGGNLAARHVIHTVGPVWSGGDHGESELLARAYENTLALATSKGLRTISFPSISTGAYRFPIERAADIALATVATYVKERPLDEVRFVLFSESDYRVYLNAASKLV